MKIRYTRGFTTEKQGSGKITTTDIVSADSDRRRLKVGPCLPLSPSPSPSLPVPAVPCLSLSLAFSS